MDLYNWMSHISPAHYELFMDCTIEFRTTDDVLDPEDHTYVLYTVHDGHIIKAEIIQMGVHLIPRVLGRPVDDLLKQAVLSPEDQHPSCDSELRIVQR